ncbi:MAG: Hsp20/alpha crystallin family protein [Betaproteobacteria bacterium]|jgi:HSP20 family protein
MASVKTTEIQEATPIRSLSAFDEMERLFDRLLARRGWLQPLRADWPLLRDLDWNDVRSPRVDVVDREAEIEVRAEVPGMDKQNLEISVGEDSVTLRGEARREQKEESGDYFRCEIARGAFSRTIGLPACVDGAKSKASFRDGVLTLVLPKVERARRHTVRID